jgi:uncharacterized protein
MNEIPGGGSEAVRLSRGQAVKLTNLHGSQVVDTWCLNVADTSEYLSVEHTRRMLYALFPKVGDTFYSNRRTPLLELEADTSRCRHDMLFACCDPWLYRFYGCAPGHANCHDNFLAALARRGIHLGYVPNPVNLWMNVPVADNDRLALEPPLSKPGDFIVLRALEEVMVIFSACPMDITPVNGDRTPRPVAYEILEA